MAAGALALVSCGNAGAGKTWSQSIAAPAQFHFWEGAQAINLPAARSDFIVAVSALGGHHYVTGEGEAASLQAPPPSHGSPCRGSARAVVVDFPSDRAGEIPRYVAYLNDADAVECIDKQFSHSGP
jgi:hypothetical protein